MTFRRVFNAVVIEFGRRQIYVHAQRDQIVEKPIIEVTNVTVVTGGAPK